jgi:hypothetical protein
MNEIIQKALDEAGAAFRKAIMAAWKSHRDFIDNHHPEYTKRIAQNMADDCIKILSQPNLETLTFSQKAIAFNAACKALGIGYREMNQIAKLEDANANG